MKQLYIQSEKRPDRTGVKLPKWTEERRKKTMESRRLKAEAA